MMVMVHSWLSVMEDRVDLVIGRYTSLRAQQLRYHINEAKHIKAVAATENHAGFSANAATSPPTLTHSQSHCSSPSMMKSNHPAEPITPRQLPPTQSSTAIAGNPALTSEQRFAPVHTNQHDQTNGRYDQNAQSSPNSLEMNDSPENLGASVSRSQFINLYDTPQYTPVNVSMSGERHHNESPENQGNLLQSGTTLNTRQQLTGQDGGAVHSVPFIHNTPQSR